MGMFGLSQPDLQRVFTRFSIFPQSRSTGFEPSKIVKAHRKYLALAAGKNPEQAQNSTT